MSEPKEKKNVFSAEEKDFIHSKEAEKIYGIGIGQQLNLLDDGKLTVYERKSGNRQPVFPSMDPDKWEALTGKSVPKPWPEEGLNPIAECKAEYRQLHKWEIGKLTSKSISELYFLRSEIKGLKFPETSVAKKINKRSEVTKAAYKALAAQIEYERANTPNLPENPIELQNIIFSSAKVRKIARTQIGTINTISLKAGLRRYGLDHVLPKSKGGRGKKILGTIAEFQNQ